MGGTAPPRCIRCSATSTGPWWRGQCESTNALAVTRHGQVSSWRPYQGRTRVSSRTGGKERSARLPDGSCVRRESHAQFCERPGVKSPRPTHHESFNVLKNNGYHLEHNFGHGKANLSAVFVSLNLLAFAFHTVCDLAEDLWRKAMEKMAPAAASSKTCDPSPPS